MRTQRIVALGTHDREAPRHWNIVRMLRKEGREVLECHADGGSVLRNLRQLWNKGRKLIRSADAVLVTFPGHYYLPLAWALTRFPRRRLIFDAFISLHDTIVDDRKKVSRWHPYAWFLYLLDWTCCHLADEVWIDTEAHRRFFIEKFHVRPDKIKTVYLGARSDLFHPAETKNQKPKTDNCPTVLFYGTFIPLQGIEHIIDAARIVATDRPDVRFTIVGSGQTRGEMVKRAAGLPTVTFTPRVPFGEIPALIRSADLTLGIFGTTGKASRVIPHKVYDAVACGARVVTADTPAIREKFGEKDGVYLVPAGDPAALAAKIRTLIPKTH